MGEIRAKVSPLTESDRNLIADFVDSEFWKPVKKVLLNSVENIKTVNLASSTLEEVFQNRGRAQQVGWELTEYKRIHSKVRGVENKEKVEETQRKVKHG